MPSTPEDAQVIRVGSDTSGRPVYMTRRMAKWWQRLRISTGLPLLVAQGAYMSRMGGGATASAGYHDWGGCLDISVRNLDDAQARFVVREARRGGAGAWLRDAEHGGMDPHIHLVLGYDYDKADGAVSQWAEYLRGGDGIVGDAPDYHWRPDPIVKVPPARWGEKKQTKDSPGNPRFQ